MTYEISIDDQLGIVEIRLLEAAPHSAHVKARDELLEICRTHNIRGMLVDARDLVIRDRPSTLELFDFGVSWSELAKRTPVLVAGLLPRDAATRERVLFGDTVATNRGLVSQAFDDIEEARAWLRSSGNIRR